MSLRRQLLLVSLLTLCLPWAGCQYIREVEKILRQEKTETLASTAKAIAAHLASESQLFDINAYDVQWFGDSPITSSQLYFHPLPNAPTLDGHDDDWQNYSIDPVRFEHDATEHFTAEVYSGLYNDTVFLNFSVFDNTWQPHNPQRNPNVANGDRIILRMKEWGLDIKDYYLRTSVDGNITARYVNNYGATRSEPRISGYWRLSKWGYDVEVQIPRSVTGDELGFSVVNKISSSSAPTSATISLGTLKESEKPLPWISRSNDIEKILSQYTQPNRVLEVVNRGHWLLAREGNSWQDSYVDSQSRSFKSSLLLWLYKLALSIDRVPLLPDAHATGRIDSEEALLALGDQPGANWYSMPRSQLIGRAAVPITIDGQIVGSVLVSESTDEILSATQGAFTGLIFYSVLAVVLVIFVLVGFGSVLTFRIRRLSRAADEAIADDGRIREDILQNSFLKARSKDEVGDLARSYGGLLGRLQEYTDYLRTLSSKLSHELRTPLAVVRSSLDNIERGDLDKDVQQYLERAEDGAARLSNILSAMSAASHMEQSIQSSELEDFNLAELINDVTNVYRDTFSEINIKCHVSGQRESYQWQGAPELIVQMLDKLVDNAADFTGSGGSIKIDLVADQEMFWLSVSNTGPLLPLHMQGQLFDSLVSLRENSSGSNQSHLGLGLYIVRLVSEFHGGNVVARNLKDDSGVVFTVRFPIAGK